VKVIPREKIEIEQGRDWTDFASPGILLFGRPIGLRGVLRLQRLEAQAHSRRRQKAITKQLSYKLLRPIAAYDSERYALF
jgi:hypothetical protein